MAKTVLIMDDNAFVRHALCELFKREPDFEVCGEAENGKEAIEKASRVLARSPDSLLNILSTLMAAGLPCFSVLANWTWRASLPSRSSGLTSRSESKVRGSRF